MTDTSQPPPPDDPDPTDPTSGEDVRQAGALAGDALGDVVEVAADMHGAIADRVGSFLPPGAAEVNQAQRAIARAIYGIVAEASRAVPRAGAEVAVRSGVTGATETSAGRAVLPLVSGFWGDQIAQRYPDLGIPMAVRVDQRDVAPDADSVGRAFPAATGHVLLFVHGLAGSELAWWRPTGLEQEGERVTSYGDRLAQQASATPVYVRYNSGQRISENGRLLNELLATLAESWPVPLEQVSIVGHSMGGLVARSASTQADEASEPWVDRLRHIITLGSPHGGAPLEQGVNVADWVLATFPETRPLARVLRSRSVGVKDLRFGSVRQEDWWGHDPDEFLRNRRTEAPFVAHVAYFFVAGTLTADPAHPAGRLIGDGMVRLPSARAEEHRRLPFVLGGDVHLGSTGHLALLNHPDLDPNLLEWLAMS